MLTDSQRDLLLAIRRDHPQIATTVILRTLVTSGRLPAGTISDTTLRRLYADHGLDRKTARHRELGHPTERRRWQAARAHQVWHADVMHGPALDVDGTKLTQITNMEWSAALRRGDPGMRDGARERDARSDGARHA